jgi:hypothetical protein
MKRELKLESSDRDKLLAAYDLTAIADSDLTQVIVPGEDGRTPVLVTVIARGVMAELLVKWLERRRGATR